MVKKRLVIIIALIIAAAVAGGFLYWKNIQQKNEPRDVNDAATAGVLPEINPTTNPIQDKLPELNPVEKTNPFKDVYKNPFE